jgi:hypothetical protein
MDADEFDKPFPKVVAKANKLEDMFERMEIAMVGGTNDAEEDRKGDNKSDNEDDDDDSDVELNQSYVEDNKISQKH